MGNDRSVKVDGDVEHANVNTGDNVQQNIHYGISPELFAKYTADLGVTDCALENFKS